MLPAAVWCVSLDCEFIHTKCGFHAGANAGGVGDGVLGWHCGRVNSDSGVVSVGSGQIWSCRASRGLRLTPLGMVARVEASCWASVVVFRIDARGQVYLGSGFSAACLWSPDRRVSAVTCIK